MGYKFRLVLYYLNWGIIVLSFTGIISSIIMMIIESDEQDEWLTNGLIFVILFVFFAFIYIIRKSKLPAAGKDYH